MQHHPALAGDSLQHHPTLAHHHGTAAGQCPGESTVFMWGSAVGDSTNPSAPSDSPGSTPRQGQKPRLVVSGAGPCRLMVRELFQLGDTKGGGSGRRRPVLSNFFIFFIAGNIIAPACSPPPPCPHVNFQILGRCAGGGGRDGTCTTVQVCQKDQRAHCWCLTTEGSATDYCMTHAFEAGQAGGEEVAANWFGRQKESCDSSCVSCLAVLVCLAA